MQIPRDEDITCFKALMVLRLSKYEWQNAVVDQILPMDARETFGQYESQTEVAWCDGRMARAGSWRNPRQARAFAADGQSVMPQEIAVSLDMSYMV